MGGYYGAIDSTHQVVPVYVASWLKVLRGDKRAIFTAAAKAQQAADWMHARQPAAAEGAGDVA